MIGPIKFARDLYCGSRPETQADIDLLATFVKIDLERRPVNGQCDFWFPLGSLLPPSKFEVAAAINALAMPIVSNQCEMRIKYLHCRTCRDRTPYVVAKYMMVKQGKSRREALQFIEQFPSHWYLAWWRLFI